MRVDIISFYITLSQYYLYQVINNYMSHTRSKSIFCGSFMYAFRSFRTPAPLKKSTTNNRMERHDRDRRSKTKQKKKQPHGHSPFLYDYTLPQCLYILQHLVHMTRNLHHRVDLGNVTVFVDQERGAFDAPVFFAVHVLFFPDAVLLAERVLLISQ